MRVDFRFSFDCFVGQHRCIARLAKSESHEALSSRHAMSRTLLLFVVSLACILEVQSYHRRCAFTSQLRAGLQQSSSSLQVGQSLLDTNVEVHGDFSGVERIILSCNGNLQRVLSAYFGAPIKVDVKKSIQVSKGTFEREVLIRLGEKVVCCATGKVIVHDSQCLEDVESGRVGIGQLYRRLGQQPSMQLLACGRAPASLPSAHLWRDDRSVFSLWRHYTLSSPQVTCDLLETFADGFLDWKP